MLIKINGKFYEKYMERMMLVTEIFKESVISNCKI